LDEEVLDALVFLYGEVYYVVLEAVGVDVDGDEEEVDGGVFAGGEGGGLGVAGEVAQEHLVYLQELLDGEFFLEVVGFAVAAE
jgi:hypothetical protein